MNPSILFLLFLASTIVFVVAGRVVSPRYWWLAAFCAWCASFLGAFSIGLYLLVVPFVLVALAIATEVRSAGMRVGAAVPVIFGVIAWAVAAWFVDDYWLFRPVAGLVEALVR